MRLLLDLGNTRLKWTFVDDGVKLGSAHALAWRDDMETVLTALWPHTLSLDSVWAASVVDPVREQKISKAVKNRFGLSVQWIRTPAQGGGIKCAYANPRNMGVDRFMGLVAAYREIATSCVLISCGTALVLDALADGGDHLGGLIAPGATLMQQAVLGATVQVKPVKPGILTDFATSTGDALTSGCWQACGALADRFITRMKNAMGETPHVLLGGGDAGMLELAMESPAKMFPNAVLKGLAIWSEQEG